MRVSTPSVSAWRALAFINVTVGLCASIGFAWFSSLVYGMFGVGEDGLVLFFAGVASVLPLMALVAVCSIALAMWLESRDEPPAVRVLVYVGVSSAVWCVLIAKLIQWWPRVSGKG
jgi:hypothetical protein